MGLRDEFRKEFNSFMDEHGRDVPIIVLVPLSAFCLSVYINIINPEADRSPYVDKEADAPVVFVEADAAARVAADASVELVEPSAELGGETRCGKSCRCGASCKCHQVSEVPRLER